VQFVIVVNPASGRHRGDRVAAAARDRLVAAGHRVVVVRSTHVGPTQIELAAALDRGVDHVLAVGGDGLLHAVLDLVVERDVTLGLLPAGTGNDAARALGVPVGDPEAALDVVLRGRTRTIDLAEVVDDAGTATLVATVVASGFDSKVNERANQMRWPRGNLRYTRAILAELRTFEPLEFELTLDDGEVLHRHAMLVAVGNGPSFGGGLRICEGAVLDDGLLDVVVINPVSTITLLRVFPRLSKGTHTSLPQFERHRVRSVRLESPGVVAYGDGERLGPLPREVRVRPAALRVFVP
jgi:diacylglycerol kinase (ATP)